MKPDEIIIERLNALQTGLDAISGVLGQMIDTLRSQTVLLKKLSECASEEPATSQATKVLGELTSAIMDLGASVGEIGLKFDNMSEALAAAAKEGSGIVLRPSHGNGGTR